MRVLGISGSPRRGGNTDILVNTALEVLAGEGLETEFLSLADRPVKPCVACRGCFASDAIRCVQEDPAFEGMLDKFAQSDGLVIGSPVYFGSATPQIMALLDRVGYVAREHPQLLRRKVGAAIVVARRAGQITMSIQIDGNTTVRDLVGRFPQTRKVFEQYGIDYCCGGGKCLAEAAHESQAALPDLARDIETALAATSAKTATAEKDWYAAPLHELIDHILQVHHAYMHEALPRLGGLVGKVLHAHGAHHGDMLRQVQVLYGSLDTELTNHLRKEEEVLFPYIVAAEAHRQGGPEGPAACFGSVGDPIRQMEREHESAGEVLAQIRKATGGYALPDDACPTFRALYEELEQMEKDLHQHIHLENNILFPKANAAEASK
jgi:regulator of cell morphogenesis and NO signaling